MFFKEWLTITYKNKDGNHKDNRFGDLAYDVEHDDNFPLTNDLIYLVNYLDHKHACNDAIQVLREAYKKFTKSNP